VNGTLGDLASYGLGGLIFVTMVVPLAIIIRGMYERQITRLEEEVVRQRGEMAELRKALDPVAPALAEMGTTMRTAIQVLSKVSS
jgi:hypothetical protein